ncbi:MAG: hypothetical protein IKF66_01195 [Methanobrevibacter sp.]|nr:hypothetical protein [Methanobrevibacter sp.]
MVQVKLIEQKQYDNNGVTAFLIFYLNGKKEGAGKLYFSSVYELPENEQNICKSFNPVVDFSAICKDDLIKEAEIEEDDIVDWLEGFGYEHSVISKLY